MLAEYYRWVLCNLRLYRLDQACNNKAWCTEAGCSNKEWCNLSLQEVYSMSVLSKSGLDMHLLELDNYPKAYSNSVLHSLIRKEASGNWEWNTYPVCSIGEWYK